MPYTARKLITRAYNLAQIVSPELQTVSGTQLSIGLELLNDLLEFKSTDLRLIPYWKRDSFPTVAGQEEYFIENLLAVETLTFNLQQVRFGMEEQSRIQYFGQSRVNNIQSLPFTYHLERELDGSRIYLYYIPNAVYTMQLTGKFGLTQVTIDQDLSLTYDRFYIEYLRHALAEYQCSEFGLNFPDQAMQKYKEIVKKLTDVSSPDLSIQTIDYFSGNNAINWAVVNLSNGYLPGG